ncbi:hypothetical protein [Psychromonas aquimarina]|uniref:hypothetical protein n=1 Tax=Psychromonas aquimarina TaxID=444919 RepID=UPI00040715F7|nr:hypothetical protein [Psychromonas aquimarina]
MDCWSLEKQGIYKYKTEVELINMKNEEFKKEKCGGVFLGPLVSLIIALILTWTILQPSNATADEVLGDCSVSEYSGSHPEYSGSLSGYDVTKNECVGFYSQIPNLCEITDTITLPNGGYQFRAVFLPAGGNGNCYPGKGRAWIRGQWEPAELCDPSYKSSGQCVLDCPYGLQVGNTNQCAPEPRTREELNRADEGICTNRPVNIATGNKFFRITDYLDNSNPLLKITRTYDSIDGDWTFNSSLSLSYHEDVSTYILTFANGSKGTFVKQGDKWIRYENKIQDYLIQTVAGEVIYHAAGNYQAIFNDAGQVKSEQQGSNKVTYSYAANGDVTITDPIRTRTLTITFNKSLKASVINLPNQKQVIYAYDDKGRLFSVNNQDKETTYLFEDANLPNAITKVIDANDKTYKEITYYPDGRVKTSSLNAGNEVTGFTYPAINKTTTTNALGKQTTYTFTDIKGVKKVTKVQGHASANCLAANQNYEYYDDGQLESKTDWKGIKTKFEYNDRGLEKQRTEASGTKDERVITTTWHDKFNLPKTVTVGNQVTTYSYDTNGQLLSKKLSKI